LNTSGTRLGLKENSGGEKQEGKDVAYVLVKRGSEDITRAKRCSKVSPINSGSSLISTLYFNIIIVMTATLSVSKNLKKKISTSPRCQRLSPLVPFAEARPGTYKELVKHDQVSLMTRSNLPALNVKKASRGQSSRNRSGRNVCGSFQYLAVILQYDPVLGIEGSSTYGYDAGPPHERLILFPREQGM
jgi:hypothetical protein